ncbi:MAG: hypothetical protein ACRC8S_22745 [Fimbriiglobus sp.]
MALFGRIYGSKPPSPKSEKGLVEKQVTNLIQRKLLLSEVPVAEGVVIEDGRLMTQNRRLAITVEVREVTPKKVHAHIIAWLPNSEVPEGYEVLDACVLGYGPRAAANEQLATIWVEAVGAPILSCLMGQPVLGADHFEGTESWGVPGGHGFVGPFLARAEEDAIDMEALAKTAVFDFDNYPRDGRPHLVKAVLIGHEGRWDRYLEIDGHKETYVHEDWPCELPVPESPVICVRFAVFDMK